jgi:hypothetical protein
MSFRTYIVAGVVGMGMVMGSALPGMTRSASVDSDYFGANVRSEPSLQASVLDGLPHQTSIEVLKIVRDPQGQGYWYYARSSGQFRTEGWIDGNLVRFQPNRQTYGLLNGDPGDSINIRSAPSLNAEVRHTGVVSDLVAVGESRRGKDGYTWYYITYSDQSAGWVRGDLINVWPNGCIITCPAN